MLGLRTSLLVRRALRAGVVSGMLLVLAAGRARALDVEACLGCHADKVDGARFAASAHAPLGCDACHADIEDFPHPDAPAAPDCASCHEDVVAEHAGSAHGTNGKTRATCGDCHGDIHGVVPHTEPASPVHWSHLAGVCARCHANGAPAGTSRIPVVRPVDMYLRSVHAQATANGTHGAVCSDCHGAHAVRPATDPASPLAPAKVAETCGACHTAESAAYLESIHGQALARGVREAPTCTSCHGEHGILAHTDPKSPVFATNLPGDTCGPCHESIRLSEKYGIGTGQVSTFRDSFHGLALRSGRIEAANCASCHGFHDVQPSSDPRSHIHPTNLAATCGHCHPGAGTTVSLGPVHVMPNTGSARIVGWIRTIYLWVIGLVIGGMLVHNGLDLLAKARRHHPMPTPAGPIPERMSRALRWQHGLVIMSFPLLVYSGFALTYPESWWAKPLLAWESTIPLRGLLHRSAAVVLLIALGWHVAHIAIDRRLRKTIGGLAPSGRDVRNVAAAFAYYVGLRPEPPRQGTFSYAEKAEYWAFMWGNCLMAFTGFLLWFENVALAHLPKWATDVATALHFWEAVLATLAILVWHLYWVAFDPDVYPMDASWWHGRPPAARAAEREAPADEG